MDGPVNADENTRPMLLVAKVRPPLIRSSYVRRERLHSLLSRAASTPVTLVSAPAGSGKTALISAWQSELPSERCAWMSLDVRDNDPVRAWAYIIEALHGLVNGVGDRALHELVRSGASTSDDRWLALLVNDLSAVERPPSFLVLDDLHVITDPSIRESVTRFAASMPSWLHLIIATRADPPFPLPRMRAKGRLTEIRASDLRFDNGEAEQFLRAEGIDDLRDDQLQWLMQRTEGWAAGLQLAAIVSSDDPSPDRFQQIAGGQRPFADYIVSEVVDPASDDMRTLLFTTAILDRVNPPLAEAVSGIASAKHMLREAQDRGFFLVALDEPGEWFRYHALFAEAVQSAARAREPELLQRAHERAARWFEDNNDTVTALEHWLAAGQTDEALRIVLDVGYRLMDTGRLKSIERIANLLPLPPADREPRRQLDYAMMFYSHDADVFMTWVNAARSTIAALDSGDRGLVEHYNSVLSISDLVFGKWDDAVEHATAAIGAAEVGIGDTMMAQRSGLQLMRGLAWLERTDEAERVFRAYLHGPQTDAAVRNFVAPCTWAMAAALGGRMVEAAAWCATATAVAERHAVPLPALQELLFARVLVNRESGNLESARSIIGDLEAVQMKTYHSLRTVVDAELALGLIEADRAAEAAPVLERIAVSHPHAPLGPRIHDAVDRAWAELHLASGDLTSAMRSAERMRVGFWRATTLARVLLAAGQPVEATDLIATITPTSPRQSVNTLLLRARCLEANGAKGAANEVASALAIASTEGMFQTLVSAARGMDSLVERASTSAPTEWMASLRRALAKGPSGPVTQPTTLIDRPTEREREVARFLASRLTVPEIARELGVTPNTLKTHLKSLYRKLDVGSREQAVTAARRAGILR